MIIDQEGVPQERHGSPRSVSRQQAAAQALLRRRRARSNYVDYNRFIGPPDEMPQKHHIVSCNAVDALIAKEQRNIMLFQPPGTAKTTYTTVRAPGYYLGRTNGQRKGIITCSNTQQLASHFGNRARRIVKSPAYQAIFPGVTLTRDTDAKAEWETTDGGFYVATGIGGAIAGRRGDLGIIDDPNKNRKDADSILAQDEKWGWYLADFLTRLKPDTRQQLLIGTRWTENDIFGRILPENWQGESGMIHCRDGLDWLVINMAAENASLTDPLGRPTEGDERWLWPEFFTPDYWESTKTTQMLIPRNWWSLYQGVPSAHEGNLFKRSRTQHYDTKPRNLNHYVTGDYAVSDETGADWTVIIVWGVDDRGDIYVVDIYYDQEEIVRDDLDDAGWLFTLIDLFNKWRPLYHGAETGPIKRVMSPLLRREMRKKENVGVSLEWFNHSETDKVGDSRAFLALFNSRRVYWPRTEAAEWVLKWLYKFPTGALDDAVDACSMFGKLFELTWDPAEEPPEEEERVIIGPTPMKWADMMTSTTQERDW